MPPADLMLDSIEPFELPPTRRQEFLNELRYLSDCRAGLELLAHNVHALEQEVASRVAPSDKIQTVGFGNVDFLGGIPMGPLNCMFHWFAVSACNYAKVVGSVRCEVAGCGENGSQYAARVLPVVQTFRDKVAAHPVGATANKKDNLADRQHSYFPQVAWDSGRFTAAGLTLTLGCPTGSVQSKATAWSVTETFRELTRRYWAQVGAN